MTTVAVTEADFQAQIVQLARLAGWRTIHVRRTIGKGRRWTTGTGTDHEIAAAVGLDVVTVARLRRRITDNG